MENQTPEIKVTRVHKVDGVDMLKGFADISINGMIAIRGLRVVNGKTGLFVSMPQTQGNDKKWYDVVHPLNAELRQKIGDQVLVAYHKS